jgi:hypothetical protein
MKHARSDYDAIQPWPTKRPHIVKVDGVPTDIGGYSPNSVTTHSMAEVDPIIPDDEPVFLIRAQDRAAIPAAEAWCEAAEALGADAKIVQVVRDHIEVVRRWQESHPTKVPDLP